MKWVIAAISILIGLGVWEKSAFVGLVFLAVGGAIIWYAISSRVSTSKPPPRPTGAMAARSDSRDEIARAERQAKKQVKKARKAATEQGQAALARANAFVQSEPRWV